MVRPRVSAPFKAPTPNVPNRRSVESERTVSIKVAPPTSFGPGTTIVQRKNFEVIEMMAEGGMGQVYKAYDPSMDRYIALKILKHEVPESERMRFHREALIAANFSHPNLVRVLEVGASGGLQWMAMEHLRGRDLGELLSRGQTIAFRLLLDIFTQALDALHYIHIRNIVHCDIKPENLFITRDLYDRKLVIVKLIDFGISRVLGEAQENSRYIMGDPRYMAPEQSVLNGHVDARSDLYSLGMTFFEAVTLRHPIEGAFDLDVEELLRHQRTTEPPPPSTLLPPHTPTMLAQAIDRFTAKACAKNPQRRFQDALSMRKALETMLDLLEAEQPR
jgi:serine/threonine-protein kinase